MSTGRPGLTRAATYAIRVQGRLDARWANWFDGFTLAHDGDGDGTTVITGTVVDQAALHGVLQVLRDLGLPLLSVTPVTPVESDATVGAATPHTGAPPAPSSSAASVATEQPIPRSTP